METFTVRGIVAAVESGQLRIPAFQRGFVWEPDRVAFFMDSLYKGYPFGSLLIWRTNEKLLADRKLGPLQLPEPKAGYPIDYVLDGQQRITSVFLTFQTTQKIEESEEWKDIYFDFTIEDAAQENQFLALNGAEADPSRYSPLRAFFESVVYRRLTKDLKDDLTRRLDQVQGKFQEVPLPAQIFKTQNKGAVAVIFERINRQGVPLDTLQLLSAWTWSEDFQLQGEFDELGEELDEFGYSSGNVDENLLLRCAAAILVSNPRPESIVEISGDKVRSRFDEVFNGIKGALDFVRNNFGVQRIDNLPFQTLLVPLSVFFAISGSKEVAVTGEQRSTMWSRWFWRSVFGRRYSSGVLRYLEEDIKSMLQLKGGQASNLGEFRVNFGSWFFASSFNLGTVNTKTLILLLAQLKPLSFISGTPINLQATMKDYNKAEFHHLMPKAFLKDRGISEHVNSLANFAFISKADNRKLGGVAPSQYKAHMAKNVDEILDHSLVPSSLFSDDFKTFFAERIGLLTVQAQKLIA